MGELNVERRGAPVGASRRFAAMFAAAAFVLSVLVGLVPSPAGATELPAGPGTITVDQGPVGPTGFCLPPLFALTHSVQETATTFVLTINASPSLCEPVSASAVIYAMPTDGSGAWPQQLAVKQNVLIPGPGVTTVTFHKGCLPAQYDVVTGATPPTIAPTGPWHGPLLFPFSLETSLQFFGGDCGGTGGNCDDYTPTNVTVEPSSVAPGGTVTVAGSGTPGTTIDILLQQPPASAVPTGASVTVGTDGHWTVPVTVPGSVTPGQWQVVARVDGCETQTTADLTVTGEELQAGSTPTTPPTTPSPTEPTSDADALSVSTEQPLPAAAVEGTSATNSPATPSSASTQAAGLAFTGSTVKLPILVGIGLLVAGALLLLQRRRRS